MHVWLLVNGRTAVWLNVLFYSKGAECLSFYLFRLQPARADIECDPRNTSSV